MIFEYKFTDDELKNITFESFKSYIQDNKKTVTESRWDHTRSMIEDIELILKYEKKNITPMIYRI